MGGMAAGEVAVTVRATLVVGGKAVTVLAVAVGGTALAVRRVALIVGGVSLAVRGVVVRVGGEVVAPARGILTRAFERSISMEGPFTVADGGSSRAEIRGRPGGCAGRRSKWGEGGGRPGREPTSWAGRLSNGARVSTTWVVQERNLSG